MLLVMQFILIDYTKPWNYRRFYVIFYYHGLEVHLHHHFMRVDSERRWGRPRQGQGAHVPGCSVTVDPSPWASCLPRGLSVGLRGRLLRELTVPPPPRPLPRAQSPGRTPLTAADDLVNRCECVQQMSDGALPKCGRAHLLRHLPTCSPTSRTHSSLLAPAPSFILTPATALALQSAFFSLTLLSLNANKESTSRSSYFFYTYSSLMFTVASINV